MYKIYINETPLILVDVTHLSQMGAAPGEEQLIARYNGKSKSLLNYIDMLEKTRRFQRILIHSPRLDQLWADFQSLYTVLSAAGGLVVRPDAHYLMIFRRGSWDLPKGKIDAGETREEAAIREVQEETGLSEVTLGAPIMETYHTYRQNGNRMLKHTYWFHMQTNASDLVPQAEEDIERAEWIRLPEQLSELTPIYSNVRDVIERGLTR